MNRGYDLQLADGNGWHILPGDGEAAAWVDELAAILRLRPAGPESRCRLVIFRKGIEGDCIAEGLRDLPGDGWTVRDLRSQVFYGHENSRDILCDIGPMQCRDTDYVKMWMTLAFLYDLLLEGGCLPFHGALLARGTAGVLIGAPGGTGKSTCCRRVPFPWTTPGDDEALIVRDRRGKYFVHPFPTWSDILWRNSGRTWPVEEAFPLEAVFFLERAETDEVRPIGQGQAALLIHDLASPILERLWRHSPSDQQRARRARLFHNAADLAGAVPSFVLSARLEGSFWNEMEKALDPDKDGGAASD